jgi:iron complex outermembrane receptor protein
MKTNQNRTRLLASTIVYSVVAALVTSPVAAQAPATSTAGSDSVVGAIVVTGSRIPQSANLSSVSPIQTVTAQEFQLQGRTDTSELLYTLPQVTFGKNDLSSSSNPLSGPGGVATVNLRGLGQTRTLVLVDGRRLGIGDPNTGNPNPSPDINQIPSQLIDRVEVLTGGASSTYGSDAVAGVVNFVMKKKFSGVQIDAQYGTYQHNQQNDYIQGLQKARGNIALAKDHVWDGQAKDASVIFGVNSGDGRGNITVYGTYHDQQPVKYSRRDFANCQLNITVTGTNTTGVCAGSSNSNIFYSANAGFSGRYAVSGNSFVPYVNTANTTPPGLFNSNPYEYLQHGDRRYSAGYFADYEINKNVDLYSDFAYMKDKSNVVIAPAALFQGSGVTTNAGFLVNCNNPFLSAQQRGVLACSTTDVSSGATKDLLIGRRNIEGGGRVFDYSHENYRFVLGAKGEITGPWKYDVYGSRYYTAFNQASQNYISLKRIQQSLLVTTNAAGQPTCIDPSGGCVPYNIFKDGGVTSDATKFLAIQGSQAGSTTESIASGSITGDLTQYGLKSPFANDGMGVAFGGEYRKDALKFNPDEASKSGDLSGAGGASVDIDQSLSVKEFFAEGRLPLVQDKTFAKDLLLEAGYRYSDYSTGISASTYKLGAQWAPVTDIRFRGSYQRAIRAPSILDLYTPQAVTNTSDVSVDPCSPLVPGAQATASLAACQRTGVTAAQYGNGGSSNTIPQCPSGQCAVLTGGNTVLTPEKANTYSLGFTTRPSFIPGLIASADYYSISVADELGTIPLPVILNKCLTSGLLCNLIKRAPNGILFGTSVNGGGYISGTTVNVAQQKTSGVDVQVAYNMPLRYVGLDSAGSVTFSLNGTYLLSLKTTPLPGDPTYDCAGLYGPTCQSVNPTWRHTARATWNTPWNVGFTVGWRHIGKAVLETNTTDPTLTNGKTDTFDAVLKAREYFDLTLTWKANKMVSFRAGVDNVFDRDPPLVSSLISGTGTPNTYGTYDQLGRKIFVALTANF